MSRELRRNLPAGTSPYLQWTFSSPVIIIYENNTDGVFFYLFLGTFQAGLKTRESNGGFSNAFLYDDTMMMMMVESQRISEDPTTKSRILRFIGRT